MGGLPCDWNKGLSGIRQIEGKLFGQHGSDFLAETAISAALAKDCGIADGMGHRWRGRWFSRGGGVGGKSYIGGVSKK